jgi:arginine deiminase
MNSPQREAECRIAEFCLNKIGMPPIGRISGEGAYLEGGDFLPMGRTAFIGCGLRTTQPAIDQLMDNDLLGCDTLVVVHDRWLEQEQMHLDTFFNIIDYDLVTLSENRYKAGTDSSQYLTADLYVRDDNTYRKVAESIDFVRYLEDDLKVNIIPISRPDELTYACNYLTVAPRRIMAVAGQSESLQQALSDNGVNVTWLPLSNLTKGYGAAHCMTQVLTRAEE